jgi:hypothetical protein
MTPRGSKVRQAPAEKRMRNIRARLYWGLLGMLAVTLMLYSTILYVGLRDQVRLDADQFVRDKVRLVAKAVNPYNISFVGFEERDWRSDRFTPYAQTFTLEWEPRFVSMRLSSPSCPARMSGFTPPIRWACCSMMRRTPMARGIGRPS